MASLLSFGAYLLIVICIFAMLAFSLDLQLGACGLVNFGQVVFVLVGGYATGLATGFGVSPWLAMPLSALAGGLFGMVLAATVRNMSGTYWGILSLALAELVRLIVLNEQWAAGGAGGTTVLVRLPFFYPLVLVTTAAIYLLMRLIGASPFGRAIRLIRDGDRLPLSLGKPVFALKVETMFIGGMIGGLAGSYYSFLNQYISPDDGLPVETFVLWAMVILGGRGNPTGVMLGAIVMETLYVATRFLSTVVHISPEVLSAMRLVVIGALITLIMMFRPQGLLPERRRIYGL